MSEQIDEHAIDQLLKKCGACHEFKTYSAFYADKRSENGIRSACKLCFNARIKIYKQQNKKKIAERNAAYYEQNRTKIVEYKAAYYEQNKTQIAEQNKMYRQQNKTKIAEINANYSKRNRARINKYSRKWRQNKIKIDFNFKLRYVLRSRIRSALKSKNAVKHTSTFELIGCSIAKFREHIEKQFVARMQWSNHGEWHLVDFVLFFLPNCVCLIATCLL
jgi:hypothetical protein